MNSSHTAPILSLPSLLLGSGDGVQLGEPEFVPGESTRPEKVLDFGKVSSRPRRR